MSQVEIQSEFLALETAVEKAWLHLGVTSEAVLELLIASHDPP